VIVPIFIFMLLRLIFMARPIRVPTLLELVAHAQ